MELIHEENRIYAEDQAGRIIAEIDFPSEDGVYYITHTFVDESLRGQGIASLLVQEAVSDIEKHGGKVQAVCSYAKRWLEKRQQG
ncbi:MAG: N-acetyltransferase [Solobacterium sp.]|nr:N-acetyltransferase [Solobacterium sp.]